MVGRKRKSAPVASEPATPEVAASSRRRSGRVSSTGKTSKYFEEPELDSDSSDYIGPRTRPPPKKSSPQKNGKGRPSKKAKVEETSSNDDDDDEFKDASIEVGEDDDEDEDEDEDEDAPPKVTFIPAIKLRDEGGIPYSDDRMHPNTLAFLRDLKANNKRTWLKANDKEYRRALQDWETYVTSLTQRIIEVDPTIPELPFKDVNFRIYRDIRFSKDPTPYKAHFSVAFSRTGRKGPYACYYIHFEPSNNSFIAGGLWHPEAPALSKIRASIDERPERWKRALLDSTFKSTFLSSSSSSSSQTKKKNSDDQEDFKKVMKYLAEKNKENALKTRPKGFHPDHKYMDLLKLKNFTVGKKVNDGAFTRDGGMDEIVQVIKAMVGFVTHLNKIVMPDPGDDDDSDQDDDDSGQDDESGQDGNESGQDSNDSGQDDDDDEEEADEDEE
ncbi:hypothetical protein QBC43DRAFT_240146 [Cladorrhinum sp. PSN259]|nr:hypothetical protein QBC43DRAFT_240146 [Cladorrhinum sp. PSN259]